jgi:hypothetical protein
MSEFYNNYHTINNEYDTLDKMARELNNKKSNTINKSILFNTVKKEADNEEKQWASGIDAIINSNNFSYLPMNKNFSNKMYSSNADPYKEQNLERNLQRNLDENLDNNPEENNFDLSDISMSDDSYFESRHSKNSKLNSKLKSNLKSHLQSHLQSHIDSESLDSYLDSMSQDFNFNKNLKNSNKKNKNNFAKLVESLHYDECSRDSDNIFDHIKNCDNCKNKLLKFLNNKEDNEIIEFGKSMFAKSQIGAKEIITIIMLGLFVIFILDIIVRTKR